MAVMAFSPDGTGVLTGGDDGSIRLWDVANGKQLRLVGKHEGPVLAVAFSPDGKHAFSGGKDWMVRLWDLGMEKKELACFNGHTDWVNAVAFPPTAAWLRLAAERLYGSPMAPAANEGGRQSDCRLKRLAGAEICLAVQRQKQSRLEDAA